MSNLFWLGAKFLTQFDLNQLMASSCWTASWLQLIIYTEHHGPRLSLALSKVQCAFPYIYLFKCCLLFFSQQRSIQALRPSLSIWTLSTSGRRQCCACWIVFMSTTVLRRRPPGMDDLLPHQFPPSRSNRTQSSPALGWESQPSRWWTPHHRFHCILQARWLSHVSTTPFLPFIPSDYL